MVEALNRVIRSENHRRMSGIGARFRQRVGWELEPTLPLYERGDALPDDDDEDELADIENNNPPGHAELPVDDQVDDSTAQTMLLPLVDTNEDDDDDVASSTALGLVADWSDAPPASTTALDHPVDGSDAPPASTTARPMGAICRRKEMPQTLVPMATMWDPLALVPRMPFTFLLCNNQPFFQFFDEEMRELGSRRRRLPRDEMRRAFQLRLMGDWGQLHWRTAPQLLEMHRSQGTPLQPRAACRLRSLVLQRVPQPAQGGWRRAKPRPLCLQQRPRTL
jgi:hypothetical protein